MSYTAVGSLSTTGTTGTTLNLTVSPQTVGDFFLLTINVNGSTTGTVSSISGGHVTTWTQLTATTGPTSIAQSFTYIGIITSTGSTTISIIMSAGVAGGSYAGCQEFSYSGGSPVLDVFGTIDKGGAGNNAYPVLTPAGAGELYWCYALDLSTTVAGSTPGYTYLTDSFSNPIIRNGNCNSLAQAPTQGDNNLFFGTAVLIKPTGGGGIPLTATASLNVPVNLQAQAVHGHFPHASLNIVPALQAIPSGGLQAMTLTQAVSGNVVDDYGLDNVPFTMKTPGPNTILAAFIGWDLATAGTYQSPGRMPAVNVTDSTGNMWHQVGISTMSTSSRCGLWVADNPNQVSWVSVALTGWASSTSYTIVEFDNVPNTFGQVSLDFVSQTVNTNSVTGLTVPTATATGSDIVLAVLSTGGQGGALTVPTGFTGIAAAGGATPGDTTTYSMFNPNKTAGSVTFSPTWANSVPASGIIAGLKLASPSYQNWQFTTSGTPLTNYFIIPQASATTVIPGNVFVDTLNTGSFTISSVSAPSGGFVNVFFAPPPSTAMIAGDIVTQTVQDNPNFPVVQVEAAFGATPGDWSQSVDYTWDVQGLTWTDITPRVFGKSDDASITVKRGRQYELSQEETGEIDIKLDNHDGIFTMGNSSSPYYPNVVPGVPVRVSAWWQGVQYAVAFGYVERWPQEWPDMPQWGFSTLVATDAFGPMASTKLPSAVKGDVIADSPYFFFPTQEQYEFTTQSLTPTAIPLDANGLIAIDWAPGNNRYAAYRDGIDQAVTTGQALNLLGDENTALGATNYTGQETGLNGPCLFYYDPNIPTNAGGKGFSVEFWFVWGEGPTVNCGLLTAFGPPSSFYSAQATTAITNGANIVVGINTGTEYAASIPTGLWVNGSEVTQNQFNQNTGQPQHFAITTGPNGTQCYLNGVPTPVSPVLPTIPTIKAVTMGPASFAYDTSGLAVYNGFNFVAGQLAWYGYELTGTQISNHFESGFTGWAGTPAPGRFAQVLTWGQLGLKRGGTAWYGEYGQAEGTYISEAYQYEGSSASDVMSQITQTENGRCYTQGNGSVVYTYRWDSYNQNPSVTFGDSTFQNPLQANAVNSVSKNWGLILNQFACTNPTTSNYQYGSTSTSGAVTSWNVTGSNLAVGDQAYVQVVTNNPTSIVVSDNVGNTYAQIASATSGTVSQYVWLSTVGTSPATVSVSSANPVTAYASVRGLNNFGTYAASFTNTGSGTTVSTSSNLTCVGSSMMVWNSFAPTGTTIAGPSGWTSFSAVTGNGMANSLFEDFLSPGPEIPFEQDTTFSVDNQFIYNVISSVQNRGPNQEIFYQNSNKVSQNDYFMRSGLQFNNYSLMPFDVFDQVNWSTTKYNQPSLRAASVHIDASRISALSPTVFPTILGLELNDTVTVVRRPVGGAPMTVTGAIQEISHEIGPAYWHTTYQVAPNFPESQALMADIPNRNSPGSQSLAW